ncbi:hypothetical protein E3T27_09525 [Cryobacterium lyxosi]|uniref:Uncharacterized protein n=1 Tax=Cryobacterium lyxosi TaxID=1259228 RepID=A0A4R8ZEW7_9MICO|nr:hypothetical protein E3T27_09525 [Cryobacterium lyxosi]
MTDNAHYVNTSIIVCHYLARAASSNLDSPPKLSPQLACLETQTRFFTADIVADRRPQTADRRPQTAGRRPQAADNTPVAFNQVMSCCSCPTAPRLEA